MPLAIVATLLVGSLCGCGQPAMESDVPSTNSPRHVSKQVPAIPTLQPQPGAALSTKNPHDSAATNQTPTAVPQADTDSVFAAGLGSDVPVQYLDTRLQAALKSYQTTEDNNGRSTIVLRVRELTDAGVSDPQVASTLGRMLRAETSVEVKADILNELANLDHPSAFQEITLGADQAQPPEVRKAAIRALDTLGDQRALPLLRRLLTDRDAEVREAAQDALNSFNAQ